MLVIHPHARKQMIARGINDEDVLEAIEQGDVLAEKIDGRFGLKKLSRVHWAGGDLIVIWRVDKSGNKIVITAYWRGK